MPETVTNAHHPTDVILEAALAAEHPPEVRGVVHLDGAKLRFYRRTAVVLTGAPLLGLAAAMLLLWGRGLTALDFGLFFGFYVFTGLGVTVGYHRLFTHRSFEVPLPVRALLAVAGSMAVEGSIIDWVATHRRHHAYADAYGDPHSPHLVAKSGLKGVLAGLWHAHVGWFFAPERTDATRWAPDLQEEPVIRAVDRAFGWLTAASFALPGVIGLVVTRSLVGGVTAFVWGGLVRILLLHHVTWGINSICHFFGSQPFDTRDESTNNWVLSLVSFGESWHNNHHAFPTSARHGILRGQLDPGWRVIRTLEQLGVARNIRRISRRVLDRKWARPPVPLARG
ncbi:MAG: acyl-CoA desaturase [Nitriliruptorales bacterium]